MKDLTELIPKVVGDRTAVILIDAMDECAERPVLLRAIRTIMEKAPVKVIISGRSEVCQDMPKDEFPVHVLIGYGENGEDIRKYITAEVNRAIIERRLLRGKVSDQLKEKVILKLNSSAQGMYVCGQKRMQLRRHFKKTDLHVYCWESLCLSDPQTLIESRPRRGSGCMSCVSE